MRPVRSWIEQTYLIRTDGVLFWLSTLLADNDVDQTARNINDLYNFADIADERQGTLVAQRDLLYFLFADTRRDLDAFAYLTVDLHDQGEFFILCHRFFIARPLGGMDTVRVAGLLPQFI